MKYLDAASLLLSLLLSTHVAQAALPEDEVAQVVRAEMAKHIPGLALLVSRKGVPVREEGFGLASLELNVPVKPETVFQSGSMGKQFTAAAVLLLVEEGKIGLDSDPGSDFEPRIASHGSNSLILRQYAKRTDTRKVAIIGNQGVGVYGNGAGGLYCIG